MTTSPGRHSSPTSAKRRSMPARYPGSGPDCSGVDWVDSHSWRRSWSQIAQPKSSDSRMIDEYDMRVRR